MKQKEITKFTLRLQSISVGCSVTSVTCNPRLRRQKQVDLGELEASQVYRRSSTIARTTQTSPVLRNTKFEQLVNVTIFRINLFSLIRLHH